MKSLTVLGSTIEKVSNFPQDTKANGWKRRRFNDVQDTNYAIPCKNKADEYKAVF